MDASDRTAFDEDDAKEWVRELQHAAQPFDFLKRVFDGARQADTSETLNSLRIVVAASVVAAANRPAPAGFPPDLSHWIRGKESALKTLAPAAVTALQGVRAGAGHGSIRFPAWCNDLDRIAAALVASLKSEWSAQPQNLLSEEVVRKVEAALQAGILLGMRTRYDAPEGCAFSTLDAYLEAVRECAPGDQFVLWSVEDLAKNGRLLLRKHADQISPAELDHLSAWLTGDPIREFVAAGRIRADAPAKSAWGDYDSLDQLHALADQCAPAGDFVVMSLTDLLGPAGTWSPRFHVLDAMRPNERGEVPQWSAL